ncbi:MAG: YceI family protein [Legionella sp.]
MKIIKSFFFVLLLQSTLVNAGSLPQWDIILNESSLSFTATQNNAPVTGTFKEFTGAVFADPAHYEESKVDIVVTVGSVTTSYAELTSIITSSDWFNVKEFPKAEFKSTKITKKDDKNYEAEGTITIRNKSAPVTLTFTAVESPQNHLLVEGNTAIKRSTFGVGQGEWASTSEINDEVTIHFKVSAQRK